MSSAIKFDRNKGKLILANDRRRRLTFNVYTGWFAVIRPTMQGSGQII